MINLFIFIEGGGKTRTLVERGGMTRPGFSAMETPGKISPGPVHPHPVHPETASTR
jgi:hypothetical protein